MELHRALIQGGFTSMRLMRQRAAFDLQVAKRWDTDLDFANYPQRFRLDQMVCAVPHVLGNQDARAAMSGARDALARAEELLVAGEHEMIVMNVHAALGMRVVNHVHSSAMGLLNGFHALRAGGVRRHEPEEAAEEVLIDGLNLGRGMSYKNAAAQIPFGGCKMTVQCAEFPLDDDARLGFLASCIDAGHFFTGPDMGFQPELADVLRARFTRNIVGGPNGSMGPTGAPTALGTFLALERCARAHWGSSDLEGKRALVQGLGAVGLPLAQMMKRRGMRLLVADTDEARVRTAREVLGDVEVVPVQQVIGTACEVLAPCAVGGVFGEEEIARLNCEILCGAANNQLRAVSKAGELALAESVAARSITYPPEWMHNIAGVVAGYEEYRNQDDASAERIRPHLERVCGDGITSLLAEAKREGRTPTALAYGAVESRIA